MTRRQSTPGLLAMSGLLAPLTLAVCAALGLAALAMGMDASWDLRNYHFHNGWAALHGLTGRDLLVGQLASFFNPWLDVPHAFLAEHLPARAVGFILAVVQGLNFPLMAAIAWHLLEIPRPGPRLAAACGIALAGVTGAGALSELGTVFYDGILSLGVMGAVLVVVSRWDDLAGGGWRRAASWAAVAGLCVGLAFGFKQTVALFCVGLCGAFLLVDLPAARRLWLGFWFGMGVLAGLALTGGPWMLRLWQDYANPMFPFFNHVFRSPWALAEPYRDTAYLQPGLVEALTLGFRIPFHSRLVAELDFVDFRLSAMLLLVPLAGLAVLARLRPAVALTRPGPGGWLMAGALLSYCIWLVLFSCYRYIIPLEMLAPLVAVVALSRLPLGREARIGASVALVLVLMGTTRTGDWIRVEWHDKAVPVSLPAFEAPLDRSLLLLSGHEPLSYLLTAFPREARALRIDSTFTLPPEDAGFRRLMRERIEAHSGPILSLHYPPEEKDVVRKLAEFGRRLDKASCRPVTSPLGPGPYALCLTVP